MLKFAIITFKITFDIVSNKDIIGRMRIRIPTFDQIPNRRSDAERITVHLFIYIDLNYFHRDCNL